MQEFSRNQKRYAQSIFLGALTGIGLILVFAAGFVFRGIVDIRSANAAESSSYPLLGEVQSLIDQHYLREQPSAKEREYGAIRGMLTVLNDRYTFFVDPPVAQSESDVLAGTYGGIGVQVKRSEQGELALYPFADSPAEAAGIENGDILLAINDTPIDISQQADVIDQMLRGEVKPDSGVTLSLKKLTSGEEQIVFIPFAVINVPSVLWRTLEENPDIGYIQILIFTSRTPEELKNAITNLRNSNVSALVLDLRNNSGGLLQESVLAVSQFVDGGVVVYEKTNQEDRELVAEQGGLATDLPLVVLVNQGTASAAELVAGAIRDRDRGILIGQTTFGKGTVQRIYRLSDDSSLHITSAEWLTPKRQHLEEDGLQPTIEMIPDINGRDVELGEAIRVLEESLTE